MAITKINRLPELNALVLTLTWAVLALGGCQSGNQVPRVTTNAVTPANNTIRDNTSETASPDLPDGGPATEAVPKHDAVGPSQLPASQTATPASRHAAAKRPRPAASATVVTAIPRDPPIYDDSNPAYALLQQADQALAEFPLDAEGQVDWATALRSGKIAPRADLQGDGQMRVLASEIIMRNTRAMPFVMFPHGSHTEWLDCGNCHDSIFVARRGANGITMEAIFRGRFCGVCHDKVAFSTYVCQRCHSVPNIVPNETSS